MRGAWMVMSVLLASACTFDESGLVVDPGAGDPGGGGGGGGDTPGDDPGKTDPPVEVPTDCPGKALSFKPSNVDPCAIPAPKANLNLGPDTWTLDTDAVTLTNAGGVAIPLTVAVTSQASGAPGLVVISVSKLFVAQGATVQVTGRRAPLIVSFGDVRIDGNIDLSAKGDRAGTGAATDFLCAASAGAAGVVQADTFRHSGGSGGGGAGFGTAGGTGATVDNVANGAPTTAGAPSNDATLVPLRGGCRGGVGGGKGGAGGAGGGAIQIVAATTLQVKGIISVAGSGGLGASGNSGGGGGGGSGGGILLEAVSIKIDGKLTANGGGGGEGRLILDSADLGDDGKRDAAAAAVGGDSGTFQFGGNGGAGGAGAAQSVNGGTGIGTIGDASGGGGGGGGTGRIRLNGSAGAIGGNAVVSPAP